MDFDEVADELYGLDLGQFTVVRTAREKAARAAGDRDLAARIRQLRKPSTSAWLANQLIRGRRDQLEPLLALGEQLRELQASVGADQLRQLTQQRHRLVYALAQEARGLGHDRGAAISEDVARELEQTLHAALGDPNAAAALRAGRLTTGLQYAGFGPVEGLPGNVEAASVPGRSSARPAGRPNRAKADDDLAARRERAEQLRRARREAQEALDRARAELTDARARREEAEHETEDAARRADAAREHVDQVRLDLDDAEEAAKTAEYQLKAARRDADSARRAAHLAAQRVTGAERRLADVEKEG